MNLFTLTSALAIATMTAVTLADPFDPLDDVIPGNSITIGRIEATWQQELAEARSRGNEMEWSVGEALRYHSALLLSRGKFAEAEPLLREELVLLRAQYNTREGRSRPELVIGLCNLAFDLGALGKEVEAQSLLAEAKLLRRLEGFNDDNDPASGMAKASAVLDAQGAPAASEQIYRGNLQQDREAKSEQLPNSLHNLAIVLVAQGKVAEAEHLLREEVAVLRQSGRSDDTNIAEALSQLAFVLQSRGKVTEGQELLQQSLQIRKAVLVEPHPEIAAAMDDLGMNYLRAGRLQESEKLLRDALEMRERLPAVPATREEFGPRWGSSRSRRFVSGSIDDIATSQLHLAKLLVANNKLNLASKMLHDAQTSRQRRFPSHYPQITECLSLQVALLEKQGKLAEAERVARNALALRFKRHRTQAHPDVVESLCDLARILVKQSKMAEAEPILRLAMRNLTSLVVDFTSKFAIGDAVMLLESLPAARDAYLSMILSRNSDAASAYGDVWAGKGLLARVTLQRHATARMATNPSQRKVVERLAALRARQTELLLAGDQPVRVAEAELASIASEIASAEYGLSSRSIGQEDAEYNRRTVADCQKALPPNAVLIDCFKFQENGFTSEQSQPRAQDEHYCAFVITSDHVALVNLGKASIIDETIRSWREAIVSPPYIVSTALMQQCQEILWSPLASAIPSDANRIYICPDGNLCQAPWSALQTDQAGTIVLERFAIALVPSAPFLVQSLSSKQEPQYRSCLIVGGIDYGTQADENAQQPPNDIMWQDLPGSAAEAARLQSLARECTIAETLLTATDATVNNVLASLGHVSVANLSTHGFFADSLKLEELGVDSELFKYVGKERVGAGAMLPFIRSCLVFAGTSEPTNGGRSILTGEQLIDRDLSGLKLVVLSACETGIGEVSLGGGNLGLQGAFHIAGTRDVIGTLWSIPDMPTSALVIEFYCNLWKKKQAPMDALRNAQLAIYNASPEELQLMLNRGIGPGDVNYDKAVRIVASRQPNVRYNPPVMWAAFNLSGPGMYTNRPAEVHKESAIEPASRRNPKAHTKRVWVRHRR